MESSEMKKQVISLGKALVQELGLESGVDTLSKWMAHYVAEQITMAENATGDAKATAERRCFETVIKLWEHQSSFPNGRRPFKNFDPIFRALDRMDPESHRYFYSLDDRLFGEAEHDKDSEAQKEDVRSWINIALEVDGAARVLINFAFKQAAHSATDDKTKTWIKNAGNLPTSDDLAVIIRLLPSDQDSQEEDVLERARQEQQKGLRSKIEKLDALVRASKSIRGALTKEITKLSKA
jgi:hypothetical protein